MKLNGEMDPVFAIGGFEHTPACSTQPLGYLLAETRILVNYQNGLHCATGRHGFIPAAKEQALNRQILVEPACAGPYIRFMRWLKLLLLLVFFAARSPDAEAASAKIIKVLPHLLDREGRHSLSPSLYERDAYQSFLRKNPDLCAGLRFEVQWKSKRVAGTQLLLRVEIRGGKGANPVVLEQTARRDRSFSRWSSLRVDGDSYRKIGEVIAWRATLWEGDRLVAEQDSFLW